MPSAEAVANNVRFEASVNRPVMSRTPSARTWAMASSVGTLISSGSAGSVAAGSAGGTAVVAVQPRADVPFRIQRVGAQGARWSPGRDDQFGAAGEIAGLVEGQED